MNKFILLSWPILFALLASMAGFIIIDKPQEIISPIPTKARTTPIPTPTPKRLQSTVTEYVMQAFGKESSTAMVIMQEHNLDCNYGAGTQHVGLFAIDKNDPRASGYDLLNCIDNVDVAKVIFSEEGWKPWSK